MGVELPPLEFTDCLTDSPQFRENLHKHENELNKTSQQIKRLIKEVKCLLDAARTLSRAQRCLSDSLMQFSFECIGGSQTDDELVISQSLKEFGRLISTIEDERDRMMERAYDQIILPLENFRKEHIGGVKEEKKKFDKQTTKFCQTQERCLNMSTKKQDAVLIEADVQLDMAERYFCQASLDYVFRLQEVQERKKFEFVETLLGFMFGWLTFYHQGHEVAKDFRPFMSDLQLRIQKTRENFIETRNKTESLKIKMLEMRQQKVEEQPGKVATKSYSKEGYLFLMEKKTFGTTTWTKQYCTYQKSTKEFTMTPYNQLNPKAGVPPPITMVLASCTRRMSDTIEKRFCFDLSCERRPGIIYTLQALSENDRKAWMDVMDGKEPTYANSATQSKVIKPEERALDEVGFQFVNRCIEVLESRGLEEQGLYRVVGVTSKVNKLLSMGLDRRKIDKLTNLDDRLEWESKTITSALKTYLRNLPEPIMTFRYHNGFIAAAKQETRQLRLNDVHTLIHRLPKQNIEMLDILIKHLKNVAAKSDKNLMPVSNLAVCFGPTLLRPEEETVASIMDIKFYNVVVEILIENYEKIFKSPPDPPELQSTTNQTTNDLIRGSSPSTHHHQQQLNTNNYIVNNSHPHRNNSTSNIISNQQQQIQTHNQRYNHSHTSPPVTHAVIKTYYDGPIPLNNMSSSLHNVTSTSGGMGDGTQLIGGEREMNGGISSSYVGSSSSGGLMSHSEHLTSGSNNHQSAGGVNRGNIMHQRINTNNTMSAYSESNLHNMHGYSPAHNKYRPPPFHNSGLNDIRNETLNSTSSSNESVSSMSPRERDGISNSNHSHSGSIGIGLYSSPQKTKRGNNTMGTHYAKSYRPHGSVSIHSSSPSASGRSSPANFSVRRVRTLYACLGENDGELSFEPNQIITNVKSSLEPGWLEGTLNGKTGLVPENYVEMLP
ncbi:rho GTPase-activating protein 26 isoform X3 [Chrysoperla carnea]|uniref:rho GTPase-activating protein 26 isoform X3 n=1 Tax=Chrysoperla carnea TaxID=189513 RepID=UPI001D082F1C|nr:rho GTPase-activating protein 26 isoform X3 [Chrysoperla carnea]